jgi:hypothetical protein
MSAAITPRDVVAMAIRVHGGSKKLAYAMAAKQLGIAWETSRKIEVGDTPGTRIHQNVVRAAFEVFRQQRIAQIRTEIGLLECMDAGGPTHVSQLVEPAPVS